jgi:hypothetical protein
MTDQPDSTKTSVSSKSRSGRRMTVWRSLGYRLAVGATVIFLELLWRTGRIRFIGEERLRSMIVEHGAVVPVCWHQHLLICARYLVARRIPGLRAGSDQSLSGW